MSLNELFIDFDSYFAAVEQQDRPALRGRPVAVVPRQADTTCCIAASYEAKAYGVKTGTRVAEARRLCPDIAFVQARHAVYIDRHEQLVRAIETCIPVDAVMSIDEMACRLTGSGREAGKAREVAATIKRAVAEVAPSVTCSIGLAPNRFLAKMASKLDKPDGLTALTERDLPAAFDRLPLDEITGIGPRMLARLRAHGIDSVRALYAASAGELRAIWGGIAGERMHARLRGVSVPEPDHGRATIGHSHVLPPAMRGEGDALAVLHRLLQKAAWRLRDNGFRAGGVGMQLRYVDGRRWRAARRVDATQDTLALVRAMRELWRQRPPRRTPLLGVGVTLTHLTDEWGASLDLFAESAGRRRLNAAVDRLNARFGRNAVYFGGAHRALDAAPMRIAFTRIPDPKTEA